MEVQFPKDRLLSRGGFLALLRKRYPTMREATLVSMLIRQIEPIRQAGRSNRYGEDQWQKAIEWIEHRSRAYQSAIEAELFRSANIMGGAVPNAGVADSMMAGLEQLKAASAKKPQAVNAIANEITFRAIRGSHLIARAKAQKASVKPHRPELEKVQDQIAALEKKAGVR